MILPTKEDLDGIRSNRDEAEKDFKNRALIVIETLCGDDIIINDIEELKSKIYQIAHSAISPRSCKHNDWVNETENMFKALKKSEII